MQEVYSALVVEDVKDTSNYIRQRIEKLCPAIKDIQQAFSIEEAYDKIISQHFDIISIYQDHIINILRPSRYANL